MTPFEQFFIVFYALTCVAFYIWEKKIEKQLSKYYSRKFKKKLKKARKWKREMGVDGKWVPIEEAPFEEQDDDAEEQTI